MDFLSTFGRYLLMIKGMFSRPENGKMYWKEFMHQCSDIGIGSLGIVAIISVFIGAVSTIQTAYQLVSPLIPQSTIAQIVRDTVILEFAPTLVCIVLVKYYVFAFIISSVPAFYGYYVKGGALEIGRASTKAVVVSCIMILFADYILSALLL